MKYNVGDLLLLKHYEFKPLPHLNFLPRPRPRPELYNSYGIVTEAIKHSDAWEGQSTNRDNVYVWYSQIDGKEYCFFEDEVTGEII